MNSNNYQPSICIPKVERNITKNFIYDIFNNLGFGKIKNIDVVKYKKTNRNNNFNRVFVHFSNWNTHIPQIKEYYDKLLKGDNLAIVYEDPWFWKIFLYNENLKFQFKSTF